MLCTYPGGEMPYIIPLVYCVWTCVKVVLSGCITIIFVLKMMSLLYSSESIITMFQIKLFVKKK